MGRSAPRRAEGPAAVTAGTTFSSPLHPRRSALSSLRRDAAGSAWPRCRGGVSAPSFPPLVPKGASLIGQDLGRGRGVPTSGSEGLQIDGNEDAKAGPGPWSSQDSHQETGRAVSSQASDTGARTTWRLWRVFLFFLPHSNHPLTFETGHRGSQSPLQTLLPPAGSLPVAAGNELLIRSRGLSRESPLAGIWLNRLIQISLLWTFPRLSVPQFPPYKKPL